MKVYKIKVNGKSYLVELESVDEVASETVTQVKETKKEEKPVSSGEGSDVLAPIQGTVVNVKVSVGSKVKKGDCVAIIEAMKMENEVLSPMDGEVSAVLVSKGQAVSNKELLLKIK